MYLLWWTKIFVSKKVLLEFTWMQGAQRTKLKCWEGTPGWGGGKTRMRTSFFEKARICRIKAIFSRKWASRNPKSVEPSRPTDPIKIPGWPNQNPYSQIINEGILSKGILMPPDNRSDLMRVNLMVQWSQVKCESYVWRPRWIKTPKSRLDHCLVILQTFSSICMLTIAFLDI